MKAKLFLFLFSILLLVSGKDVQEDVGTTTQEKVQEFLEQNAIIEEGSFIRDFSVKNQKIYVEIQNTPNSISKVILVPQQNGEFKITFIENFSFSSSSIEFSNPSQLLNLMPPLVGNPLTQLSHETQKPLMLSPSFIIRTNLRKMKEYRDFGSHLIGQKKEINLQEKPINLEKIISEVIEMESKPPLTDESLVEGLELNPEELAFSLIDQFFNRQNQNQILLGGPTDPDNPVSQEQIPNLVNGEESFSAMQRENNPISSLSQGIKSIHNTFITTTKNQAPADELKQEQKENQKLHFEQSR